MKVWVLLDQLLAAGVRIKVEGPDLRVTPPPGANREALRDLISRHKADLLAQLHHDAMLAEPWDAPGWIDADRLLAAIDALATIRTFGVKA